MSLPTADDVRARLLSSGITDSDLENAHLQEAIDGAIALAERRTGRTFASETTTKRYDGDRTEWLWVDPCSLITKVELLDYAGNVARIYDAAEYVAYPLNSTTKNRLRKTSTIWSDGALPPFMGIHQGWQYGKGNIRVSATFGEDVPDDLREAIILQGALILMNAATFANTGIKLGESAEGYSISYGENTVGPVINTWREIVEAAFKANAEVYF